MPAALNVVQNWIGGASHKMSERQERKARCSGIEESQLSCLKCSWQEEKSFLASFAHHCYRNLYMNKSKVLLFVVMLLVDFVNIWNQEMSCCGLYFLYFLIIYMQHGCANKPSPRLGTLIKRDG